jgi:hypothetical protein
MLIYFLFFLKIGCFHMGKKTRVLDAGQGGDFLVLRRRIEKDK